MADATHSSERVKFRPRARLVDTIGGDLIRDEMAGVIELIKNAYDADASTVRLSFTKITNPAEASIVIKDNGHGMARATLLGDWMSPATGDKGSREKSPQGRPMLGRKGVGRFSAMRLGTNLALETKPSRETPSVDPKEVTRRYRLLVDWAQFRTPDKYLEEVDLALETIEGMPATEHWTRLEITHLNDKWDEKRLGRLLRELRLLLSPISQQQGSPFSVEFDLRDSGLPRHIVSGFPETVQPYEIPDVADYFMKATITASGRCTYTFERELFADKDGDEVMVSGEEPDIRALFPDEFKDVSTAQGDLPCGPVEVEFTMWDRDQEVIEGKAERLQGPELVGVRAVRRFLDEMSGAAIYRDGFRVRQDEQDWLGLGQRRVQNPTQRLGPNQLFAFVRISSSANPGLEDKSSREGLKENDAYRSLRGALLAVLSLAEPLRYRFRKRHSLGRPAPKSTRALEEGRKEAFLLLRASVKKDVERTELRGQLTRLADQAERATDLEHERLSEQAEIMHDTHALGLLARFVIHEGRNLDGALDSALANVERQAKMGRTEHPHQLILEGSALADFESSLDATRKAEARLELLLNQLDPLTRPRRGRRPKVVVEEVLGKATGILSASFQQASVQLALPKGKHAVVAWEADLFHALFNLLQNSLYWVERADGEKKVVVQVRELASKQLGKNRDVEITVSDSGPGVAEDSAESIFDLGYSEKPDGQGLGLFIAKEGIERSKGTIELMNPGERGARFRVILGGA